MEPFALLYSDYVSFYFAFFYPLNLHSLSNTFFMSFKGILQLQLNKEPNEKV